MKSLRIFFSILSILLLKTACFAQAKIEFSNYIINVDTLDEGELAPVRFVFKNTGDSNLIVSAVKSSCGCTVPKYEKKIVSPNSYDTIFATYNTVGHLGRINKIVQVESNASNGSQDLLIDGYAFAYAKNLRVYYSSASSEVFFHVDKSKNLSYSIKKSTSSRAPDISLVVFQDDTNKGFFSISKEELQHCGISTRIMKQNNSTVSLSYIDEPSFELSKEYTFIIQFTMNDRTDKSIGATINGKKISIGFHFE